MSKTGLRQLDGNSTWDITALGKVLSMVFDEQTIFGGPLEKPIVEERAMMPPNTSDTDGAMKPSLLLRSKTSDQASFSTSTARPQIIERYSSVESPPKCAPKKFDVDAMLGLKSPTTSGAADVFQDDESKSQRATRGAEASGNDLPTVAALPPPNLTSDAAGFNVDTKTDFMSALTASLDASDHGSSTKQSPNDTRPVTGPAGNRRRWMTLPLAPIQEDDGVGVGANRTASQLNPTSSKAVASDMILRHEERNTRSKQFRVPAKSQDKKNNSEVAADGLTSFLDSLSPPGTIEKEEKKESSLKIADKQRSLPTSNEDIESAGTAFLDQISKNLGIGGGLFESGGEERRVGAAHHRKTRSRCSIDWTLPPPDTSFEKDQQIEQINRNRSDAPLASSLPLGPIGSLPDDSDDSTSNGNDVPSENNSVFPDGQRDGSDNTHPLKISFQASRSRASSEKVRTETDLPDFADRISAMSDDGEQRWWPYVYEVILHQWVALLEEQTKKSDASIKPEEEPTKSTTGLSPIVVKYLSQAAKNARGATIRCAPFLLDIITQSLSWRVDVLYRERKNTKLEEDELCSLHAVPSLVGLDETTIAAMEKLITMLTDASLDSRNFDSFEYRKISINVNDAVVRFLRDLFSILKAPIVHRLVMLYFGRFVTKEGKHWHDRDSKLTGLRCSWETTSEFYSGAWSFLLILVSPSNSTIDCRIAFECSHPLRQIS